jgi:MFS family permease
VIGTLIDVTTTEHTASYREVFAEPRFRVLFASRGVAIAADTLRIFALSVLVFARTGSPLLSALAFAAGFLPQIVGGVLFGALTDRLPGRLLMFIGYLLEAALAVLLALVHLPVAVSLALVALVACGTPVFAGAASRLVADVLTGDTYVLGRSVFQAASSGAQLLGLAVGGVAVAAAGPRTALLIGGAGNVFAALTVRFGLPQNLGRPAVEPPAGAEPPGPEVVGAESAGVKVAGVKVAGVKVAGVKVAGAEVVGAESAGAEPPGPEVVGAESAGVKMAGAEVVGAESAGVGSPASPAPVAGSAVRASLTGTVELFADRTIRRLLLVQWLPSAFVAGAEALLVAYATWRHFPAGFAGALMAAIPVGMLAGDIVVGRFVRPAARERLPAPLILVLGAPLVAFAFALPLAITLGLLVLTGTGFAYGLGVQRRFLDAAPDGRRGQLFALLSTGLMTLQGLGPLVFGVVAQLSTPAVAIALAGASVVLCAPLVPKASRVLASEASRVLASEASRAVAPEASDAIEQRASRAEQPAPPARESIRRP